LNLAHGIHNKKLLKTTKNKKQFFFEDKNKKENKLKHNLNLKHNRNLNVRIRKQTPLWVASQVAPLFIVIGSTQVFK
jgi:hypothetical protein